ncbi:helix-turn-helix transcriptional regulator [Ligilactobacillus saerimneri]|uniref:helix-turn-helix transcriptional regulator n=1 Tax=Ligilactobacillus saerimneri TaxID=228229 RepID=UPI00040B147C|nr:helix-turn-helix transcriptional regulator [Ligilactobacillus saerimneri]KRL72374.1 hypothetical protein FC54_GL001106 [Ligilactobacillus saerimneri DSM 16049]
MDSKKIFAKNLRQLLNDQRINAKDFSIRTGFKYTTVLDWLKGKTYPRASKLERIAEFFDTSISALVTEESPQAIGNKNFFSAKLNTLLVANNVKQIDLHNDLGIPKSTLTGYVKGTSLPNKENLLKIANYFDVEPSQLDLRFAQSKPDPLTLIRKLDEKHFQRVLSFIEEEWKEQQKKHT